ncbi:MAG: hypothetical protein LBP92_15375, partial [Deltaproteobacteria bacterium]|nr:hypothetical protein [Deltaproteobacteria bacterium]
SVTFAKALRWLKAKRNICILWYNFVRCHSSLKNTEKTTQLMTPAMAAGITTRPWSKSDIMERIGLVN